ncbi:hypothetical protein SAMN05444955_10575 [Lihuaxuella thermophila]|uniref:Uncharacterized protein n=1 Tax=Lihuaxuella thermophila TaxID=1173111 RepID=A0A1H8DA22_9BACL|nr:hypothetical protein SAMN05444955_10575 [Lihuaxuella thermophila]
MIRPLSPHDSPAVMELVRRLLAHALFQPDENQLSRIILSYRTGKERSLYLFETENGVLGSPGLAIHKDEKSCISL